MLTLDNASVYYGGNAGLHGFCGTFRPGTVTALIGGDGAGKSTLLHALAGRLPFTPAQPSRALTRTEIGFQPAEAGVWLNLSVAENIEFVGRVYGVPGQLRRQRAQELLARAGLLEARDRVAGNLSGGMRQKLGFVLATLHQPQLVLLDEPTTGVDPVSRGELWSLIASAASEGATVIFATTYLDEAERAQQLFLLSNGRVLSAGTPDEVIAATPGRIWERPLIESSAAAGVAGVEAGTTPAANTEIGHHWRRGNTQYCWQHGEHLPGPPGYTASEPDLQNTAIALLVADEDKQAGQAGYSEQAVSASGDEQVEPAGGGGSMVPSAATGAHPPSAKQPRVTPKPGRNQKYLAQAAEIQRKYGSFAALSGVSLAIARGEIVGLLGGNGAGKTTLLRIMLGLEKPTAGETNLFGQPPTLQSRRRLGYVAQGLGLYPALSALENLRFAAAVQRAPISAEAAAFAQELGAAPVGRLPLSTKRLLAYLTATQHHPELLVLDEPTSGMDALASIRLWQTLRENADSGVGILVTTHNMTEALQCDRLVILTRGVVTAAGTVASITRGRKSLVLQAKDWQAAFQLLKAAGLPVMLDGRRLRLPEVTREQVQDALGELADAVQLTESESTLGETMMLPAAT